MRTVALLAGVGLLLATQAAPAEFDNLDFEAGTPGETPAGWTVPKPVQRAGYVANTVADDAASGQYSARIAFEGKKHRANTFGNLKRMIDATPFRGRKVRLSASIKAEGRAQMWLRVDRRRGRMGFFDNMGDRPILLTEWQRYEIVGEVDENARTIHFGLMVFGEGQAWIDDVAFEVLDELDAVPK